MENIFIALLPPWVETGLQPAFYDKESGTVLQQTARMYAKVNALVEAFNKLSADTKSVVEEYIAKFVELHTYVHDYFDNLDVQDEIDHKLDEMVSDGTLTDIISTYLYTKLYKASEIGMVTTNSEAVAIANFDILKAKMEAGFNILVDGKYYLKNTDPTKSINIISNQTIQGQDADSELANYDNQYLYLFDANKFDLTIHNLKFTNTYGHEIYVIKDNSTSENKYKYGDITITGSSFIGNICPIYLHNQETNLRDETWGIASVKFNDNFVENTNIASLRIFNVPFGEVEINNNIIHNAKPVFGRFNSTHNEDDSQGSNFLRCVKADSNQVYWDDDVWENTGTYASFIVAATFNAEITNNYIAGFKSNASTACYAAYLSCYNVTFTNNICKNIINFNSNANNYLFKAKYGEGTRIYKDNTIILDETWVSTVNASLDSPHSESDLATNTTLAIYHSDGHQDKWIIENNTIDVLRIDNKSRYRDINYFIFKDNNVKCKQMANYLIYPQLNNVYTHIIGNQFIVTEACNGFVLVQGGTYQNTCDVIIRDNIINSNSSATCLIASEGTFGNIYIENNKITMTNSTAGASVRSIALLRNVTYNSLTIKNNVYSANKTTAELINLCNGKLDIDDNFITVGMDSTSNSNTYQLAKNYLYDNKLLITAECINSSGILETTKYIITLHNDGENSYISYTDVNDVAQDLNFTTVSSNTIKGVKPDSGTSVLYVAVRTTTSYIYFGALTTNGKKVRIKVESI